MDRCKDNGWMMGRWMDGWMNREWIDALTSLITEQLLCLGWNSAVHKSAHLE